MKWAAGIAGALLVLMLATNPDQAAHMRTIQDTAALKPGGVLSAGVLSITDVTPALIRYNNYFVYSTVTVVDNVISWGAFGKVNTTNRVSDPFGILEPK